MNAVLDRSRLLNIREVESFIGVGETTIKTWVRDGRLPAPLKLSPKCLRWRAGDLEAWVEQMGAKA